MSISAEGAKAFADEILAIEGQPAWVIGSVEVNQPFFWLENTSNFSVQAGSGKARIVDSPTIIEV